MKKKKEIEDNKEKKIKVGSSKWNKILKILIVILIILIILEITTGLVSTGFNTLKHSFFRTFGIEAKEGNTVGNINNFGYITEDNKYIYYMSPSKDGQYIGISKVRKNNLTGPQTRLIEGTWEITSINSYGDYIYFVTLNNNDSKTTDGDTTSETSKTETNVDNKIHRVSKNGNQVDEVINDNEFSDLAYKMVVVAGKIYYIGEDECIWYMDLDGNHKTRLNENASGFEAITDKYILYNMPDFKDGKETSVSWIMDRNGKNPRKINGERIYTPVLYKDTIYYLTEDRYLHKMDLDGKNDTMLSDNKIYNLNVSNNGIYYFKKELNESGEVKSVSIHRMDLDGKNDEKISVLEESSNSLCLIKDWVFSLDSNSDEGRVELISSEGKQKINLFTLNYSDYYYKNELTEERANDNLNQISNQTATEVTNVVKNEESTDNQTSN